MILRPTPPPSGGSWFYDPAYHVGSWFYHPPPIREDPYSATPHLSVAPPGLVIINVHPLTVEWWCLFCAEGFHSGPYGRHMGFHCNVACASIEIQIIGNLFWTLEANCHCILVAAQYCSLIKEIWLYCRILNLQDCPKRISALIIIENHRILHSLYNLSPLTCL